jgi:large subunit ribosomal protein L3
MAVAGIIGKKVGMTQVFADDGRALPVTVIEAGPCVVVQRKSKEKDGYSAVQLGLVEGRKVKKVSKPMQGHFAKAGLPPCKVVREVRVSDGDEAKVGDKVSVELFAPGDRVDVIGVSKGKGFQGVVKRHHFRGGDATHGSMFHRAPGGIGASAYPSRVLKGMRAAGHMGSDRVTARNLTVVRVDAENNLLVLKGAVPGAGGGYLVIRKGRSARAAK